MKCPEKQIYRDWELISDFSGTEGGSGVDGKQVRGISGSEANLLKLDFGDGCIILKQLKNHELYTYNRWVLWQVKYLPKATNTGSYNMIIFTSNMKKYEKDLCCLRINTFKNIRAYMGMINIKLKTKFPQGREEGRVGSGLNL